MAIKTPRIWYVCSECGEWFCYSDDNPPKKCPDCKKGTLIKTCANCGEKFSECVCEGKT